jgi:hypothetical protein
MHGRENELVHLELERLSVTDAPHAHLWIDHSPKTSHPQH